MLIEKVGEHYLVYKVEKGGGIVEHSGITHSKEEALQKAYEKLHEEYKRDNPNATIIDETSRMKESALVKA